MSKKAWIIFAGACIVLLGGLIYISSKDKVDVSKVNTSDMIAVLYEYDFAVFIAKNVVGNIA